MCVGDRTQHLQWCEHRNLRPATVYQRGRSLIRLQRALRCCPMDATSDQVEQWYAALTMSPEGRATELRHIRQFYRWAQRFGLRTDDPTIRLDAPRLTRRLPRPIRDDDLAAALDFAADRVRPMLLFAAFAGLRAGEIARLRRDAIRDDLTPPVLIVEDGKGGRQRIIPLHPQLATVLSELPVRGWLFPRHDGQPGHIPPHLVSQLANRALRDAGTSSTLHTLRHRFATKCYGATLDLRVTQELMGHASPVTTAQYAAWTPSAGVDAIARL